MSQNPFGSVSVKSKNPEKKDYTGPTFSFEKRPAARKSSIKADFQKQESVLQESMGPGVYHSQKVPPAPAKEPSSTAKVASYKPVAISPEKRKVKEQSDLEKQERSIMLMSTVAKTPEEQLQRLTAKKPKKAVDIEDGQSFVMGSSPA